MYKFSKKLSYEALKLLLRKTDATNRAWLCRRLLSVS